MAEEKIAPDSTDVVTRNTVRDSRDTDHFVVAPVVWNGMIVPSIADEPDHGNDVHPARPED